VIRKSAAAEVAARLMGSERVQMFHDHVLVKEPGTSKPTPWHQDGPYYFVEGTQTVSFWSPLDPVKEASLRWAEAIVGPGTCCRILAEPTDFYGR
jgi:ectoine hydroxylase-related dioxygenase (phytanoyl-CoA dioxygenase family)